jgi:predicted DNA-binding transcriptional regulator AlpA
MPVVIDAPTDDPLLLPDAVARLLGVREPTLATWRSQKRYNLRYIKLGKLIRYRKSDVLAFMDFCAHGGLDDET